jgi:hypothetical protein
MIMTRPPNNKNAMFELRLCRHEVTIFRTA